MKTNIQWVTLSCVAALAVLLSTGCKREGDTADTASTGTSYLPPDTNRLANRFEVAQTNRTNLIDNTRINVRDRVDSALTPEDQGGSEADRDITQQIRKSITSNDHLSTTAKNVKIITRDRKVTLRGPVSSAEEKTTIANLAKGVAGEGNVTDELEVKTNP